MVAITGTSAVKAGVRRPISPSERLKATSATTPRG
jgi:hypothetical protein